MAPGAGPLPPASELGRRRGGRRLRRRPLRARPAPGPRLARSRSSGCRPPGGSRARSSTRARSSCATWTSSGIGWVQDLLLFLKVLVGVGYGSHPRVTEVIGYEVGCKMAEGAEVPPTRGVGDVRPRLEGEEADVVVIGSGAGGAVAATVLAEAGLDVVVLEAGPYLDRMSYPDDPLTAIESLYRDNGLTDRRGPADDPGADRPGRRRHHRDQLGHLLPRARARPARAGPRSTASTGRRRLDPEYAEAEEMLQVTPVDVERMGRNGQIVMEGAAAIGASGGPIPRNAGRCVGCSSCPLGCRLDAKRAMHVSYMPRAVAAGARVRAGVEARTLIREDGRVTGVRCVVARPATPDGSGPAADGIGTEFDVRGRAVVVAGGAIGTPELLLRNGIAGQAGRPQPPHPPGGLDRRPLRRGGPRLGRRDAELLRRRVARHGPADGGDLHAARLRRPVAARHRARARRADARLRPPRLERRPPLRRLRRPRRASTARAPPGSPTGSPPRTAASSPSGSPAPPRSSSPPARPRCTRRSAGCR